VFVSVPDDSVPVEATSLSDITSSECTEFGVKKLLKIFATKISGNY